MSKHSLTKHFHTVIKKDVFYTNKKSWTKSTNYRLIDNRALKTNKKIHLTQTNWSFGKTCLFLRSNKKQVQLCFFSAFLNHKSDRKEEIKNGCVGGSIWNQSTAKNNLSCESVLHCNWPEKLVQLAIQITRICKTSFMSQVINWT